MVPVAKASILLVLLGGATVSTYAVANGGFGNKAKSSEEEKKEDATKSNEHNSEGSAVDPGAQKPGDGTSTLGTTDSTTISSGSEEGEETGANTNQRDSASNTDDSGGAKGSDGQSPQTGGSSAVAGPETK